MHLTRRLSILKLSGQCLALIGSLFALLLTACDYSNSKALSEVPFQNDLGKAGITFKSISERVLEPNCVTCHSNYSNYESVKRELSSIQTAIELDRMPKRGPPLTPTEKQLIAQWISLGAPNDSERPPTAPRSLEPDWDSISVNLIFPKCLVCHNPQGQAKFVDFSTRQAFFNSRDRLFGGVKLLDFERPSESYIIAIVQDPVEPMPPPSARIPKLTAEEISVLTKWIELGLP